MEDQLKNGGETSDVLHILLLHAFISIILI